MKIMQLSKKRIFTLKKTVSYLICTAVIAGAFQNTYAISKTKAVADRHARNTDYLNEMQLIEGHSVLLNNEKAAVPLKDIGNQKIICLNFQYEFMPSFIAEASHYIQVTDIRIQSDTFQRERWLELEKEIANYPVIIACISSEKLAGQSVIHFLSKIQQNHTVILCVFGDINSLASLDSYNQPVLFSSISSENAARRSAQTVFGAAQLNSRLTRDISPVYKKNAGYQVTQSRLRFSVPEEAGINCDRFDRIDTIVRDAINLGYTPGAVVLVAVNGTVLFEKAYGTKDSVSGSPVLVTDIYDVASITKVTATTLAVMRLYDKERIKLDTPIQAYLPETKKTDKAKITMRELLFHEAGLVSWIPFRKKVSPGDLSKRYSSAFSVRVSENLYLRKNYFHKRMWPVILESKTGKKGHYVYSDIGMTMVKEIVERRSGEDLDAFVRDSFYMPLGLRSTGFNAYRLFPLERIVPSEDDTYFRMSTLRGYVQDPMAAMMGGVSGHAGIFSNARDIAVIFQTLLNEGTYGGRRYFEKGTVTLFTQTHSHSRNGRRKLGFDGKDPDKNHPSELAGNGIFGHSGYTGTCVWADPEKDLIFVFLSNRTITGTGNQLGKQEIREQLLDTVYEAIR